MPATSEGRRSARPRLRWIALAGVLSALAWAATASAIPSATVFYGPTIPAALDQYAAPGNVIVVTAEQRNRNPAKLREWRAKGAIVMAYVNAVDWRPPLDPIEQTFYGGAFPSQWLYHGLSEYPGTKMLNLAASCPVATYNGFTGTWGQYVAQWIRNNVIGDGSLFNGVFLDVWGDTIWNVSVGGPGSDWANGVAAAGQAIRSAVGPNVYLIGNNTQSAATAAPLNGRMWESFESRRSGYNDLTGGGEHPGLIQSMTWGWSQPKLMMLWRNEGSPAQSTKDMLNAAALQATQTGTDIAVGASDHGSGIPAPFGSGGGRAPSAVFLPSGTAPAAPPPSLIPPPAPPLPVVPSRPGAPIRPGQPGAPGTVGFGGNGSGVLASAPLVDGTPLVSTVFTGVGDLGGWLPMTDTAATIATESRRGGAVLKLSDRPGMSGYAALGAVVPSQSALATKAHVNVARLRLAAGQSRTVLAVAADPRTGYQIGVTRTRRHGLRWVAWVRANGGQRQAAIGAIVPRSKWIDLTLRTQWDSRRARAALAVDGHTALRTPPVNLRGRVGSLVSIGLGRPSSDRQAAVLLVRSVAVAA
jgi:hypothetical protein